MVVQCCIREHKSSFRSNVVKYEFEKVMMTEKAVDAAPI